MLITRGVCRWFLGFYLVLIVMVHGGAWAQNNYASSPARVPPTRRLTPDEVSAYVQGVVTELQRLAAELRAVASPGALRYEDYRTVDPASQREAAERAAVLRAQGQALLTEMVYMLATVQDRAFLNENTYSNTLTSLNRFAKISAIVMALSSYYLDATGGQTPLSAVVSALTIYIVTGFLNLGFANPVSRLKAWHHGHLPRDISDQLRNRGESIDAFSRAERALAEAEIDLTVFGFGRNPVAVANALTAGRDWALKPYKNVKALCALLLEPPSIEVEVTPSRLEPNNLTGVRIKPDSNHAAPADEELPAASSAAATHAASRRNDD